MHFISEKSEIYATLHSENEPELLAKLNLETQQNFSQSRMLSGHLQGRVLSMLSKLLNPKHILEIGTFTGYATLCLSEGLQENGTIDTIDRNKELYDFQRKYFNQSLYGNRIFQHLGNALEIISNLSKTYDLAFIDADKSNYINYFNAVLPKMNKGGVIISDNVLWSGKVIEPAKSDDKITNMLKEYNKLLKECDRVETIMLPIRDGISVSRVK